jgi:hypothetical protein
LDNLRSIVFSIVNIVNLALAFAVVYAAEGALFRAGAQLDFVDALHFSVGTFATVGGGHVAPPDRWLGKITVSAQLIVGFYFVTAIVATVVQWAQPPARRS